MTGKERLLTAMRKKQPDMVPISPDIDLIGMRWFYEKTKRPFWDVYLYQDPPIEQIYIDANKQLGCDIFNYFGTLACECQVEKVQNIIDKNDERIIVEYISRTPFGDLREIMVYPKNQPPWCTERKIKNPDTDWPKLKWVMEHTLYYPKIVTSTEIGDGGILGIGGYGFCPSPMTDFWVDCRGAQAAILDFYDYPDLMNEIFLFQTQYSLDFINQAILVKPDMITISASASSLSLVSPDIYRRFTLPLIKDTAIICKKAGILSHSHTCGISRGIVEILFCETDLDVIEPLEGPPTGDVNLREVKEKFGGKLCLKGNINTVLLMSGSPSDVEEAVKKAIHDAGSGGGFILATGDSPGEATPDKNICAMVEAGRKYGKY
jgi:hypothetical protein